MIFDNLIIILLGLVLLSLLLSRVLMLVMVPRIIRLEGDKVDESSSNVPNSFRVFCSSERILNKIWKILPWESTGVLVFDGANIHYQGEKKRGRHVQYKFPRHNVKITYLPSNYYRDGGLTWISIESHSFKFFFTSVTKSEFDLDDSESTTGIYRLVSNLES